MPSKKLLQICMTVTKPMVKPQYFSKYSIALQPFAVNTGIRWQACSNSYKSHLRRQQSFRSSILPHSSSCRQTGASSVPCTACLPSMHASSGSVNNCTQLWHAQASARLCTKQWLLEHKASQQCSNDVLSCSQCTTHEAIAVGPLAIRQNLPCLFGTVNDGHCLHARPALF